MFLYLIFIVSIASCKSHRQFRDVATPNLSWLENYQDINLEDSFQFFVAPIGDDSNPGTKNLPFATIYKAKEAVLLKKKTYNNPITVYLREGTYYFNQTLEFTKEDSGSFHQIITYSAYPGEQVTLSGSKLLNCTWTPSAKIPSVFECFLPEVKSKELSFSSLFINNDRQWPARFPNFDKNDTKFSGKGYISAVGGIGGSENPFPIYPAQPSSGVIYDPNTISPRISSWTKIEEAELHIFPAVYWGNLMYSLDSIDIDNNTIFLGDGGGQISLYHFNFGSDFDQTSRFFVQNLIEELDFPGEFYLDKETGILYVYPESGVDIQNAIVEAPILKTLIRMQGELRPVNTQRSDIYVQYILFSDFIFTQTATTYMDPYELPSGGDWTINRNGAIFMETTKFCGVQNSLFDRVGGNAVFINGAADSITLLSNEFYSTGDSGVCTVGIRERSTGSAQIFPKNIHIINNYFHDLGFYGKQVAAVFIAVSSGIVVSNNVIHDIPRSGICINDGFCGGHIIEYNLLYNVVMETSDHGPFNSWGRERFWAQLWNHGVPGTPESFPGGQVTQDVIYQITVRNNYLIYPGHDDISLASWAVDMDDGSSNFHVYENVCIGTSIKIGAAGDLHNVTNNIIINPLFPVLFWKLTYQNSENFQRNIVYFSNPIGNFSIYYLLGHVNPASADYNLFYSSPNDDYFVTQLGVTIPLKEWFREGFDQHSIFGVDPQFLDAEAGNYTVSETSPALKLGFRNFQYGPQSEVFRYKRKL